MKKLSLLLFITFLLSSCAPAATISSTSTPTQTLTPAPTATETPSPTPTVIPTPTQIGGGSGKLIFEYYKVAYEKLFPNLKGEVNVFTSSLDGTDLVPVTNGLKGYNYIQSISSDGQMVLVSSRSDEYEKGDLYLIHLDALESNPIKLASGLIGFAQAIFLDNTHIVYAGQGLDGYRFYKVNVDGTNPEKIISPNAKVSGIESSDKTRVYWWSVQKEYLRDSNGFLYLSGDIGSLWWANLDGSGQGKLESNGQQIISDQFAFSPDSTRIAWIPAGLEAGCSAQAFWGQAIWTPWVRNDQYARMKTGFHGVIDQTFVDTFVHNCFVLHIASLSEMDNDTKIPLIPPFDPAKDDFFYHKAYYLRWWPDSSKILAYDRGIDVASSSVVDRYPIAFYQISPNGADHKLTLLKVLSYDILNDRFSLPSFSFDGRLILFTKYDKSYEKPNTKILNLETTNYVDDFGRNTTSDFPVEYPGRIYWLP